MKKKIVSETMEHYIKDGIVRGKILDKEKMNNYKNVCETMKYSREK